MSVAAVSRVLGADPAEEGCSLASGTRGLRGGVVRDRS